MDQAMTAARKAAVFLILFLIDIIYILNYNNNGENMPMSIFDLGINLDPDRRFPGLGRLDKEEWSKKIITRYLLNVGPLLLGFALVTMFYAFSSAAEFYYFTAALTLCVGISFYFTRRDALRDRTLVWVESTTCFIKG
jgi:hypothetical protein